MKIAFICPDGISILLFCKEIIRMLKTIENSELYVLSSDGNYRKDIEALGAKSISVDMYRFFNPIKDFKYFFTLYRIFRSERFDLIFNFSTKPNIYGTLAAKAAKVDKTVSHVVGLGATFLKANSIKNKLIKYIFLELYRISFKFNDKVWFTNSNDLNYFLSQGMITKDKTVLSRNYLNPDFYSPAAVSNTALNELRKELGINVRDKVVVMVARMIWPKGIKEFAEASEYLKDKHPFLKFLLVAPLEEGSAYSIPESYIREKEKISNLKWLQFRNDVREIYAISDLAVLPSYYKEGGYPRALLEPMAMGKPVIAADTPDCRGPVEEGKNGYLVPAEDSKSLAQAIEKLILNENKSKEFGKYSRQIIEREFNEKLIIPKALAELGILLAT